ncbi:MAG: hypothetical protein ACOX4B_03620 [Bacillota bacterium]
MALDLWACKRRNSDQTSRRRSYERFVTDGKTDAAGLLRRVFTKKQLSMALKRADLECIPPSGEMRYVQWLCLFRSYLATR